jgi:uncharacterized Zn finger protein (UPF0148 family)
MEAVNEKSACAKCGAEVREGTAFCYACGTAVAGKPEPAGDVSKTVQLDANGSEPSIEKPAEDKLTKAREERKKARVHQRKTVEYTWEPVEDMRLTLLAVIVITALVAVIVAAMVYWK